MRPRRRRGDSGAGADIENLVAEGPVFRTVRRRQTGVEIGDVSSDTLMSTDHGAATKP
jgi:hypothetical protein